MQTPTPTNEPVSTTSESTDLGSLSFTDYQAIRRGEKVESKPQSAPVEKTEQKSAAKSDPAETEEDSDESEVKLDEESDESKESDQPKKKGGFKRRIDKLSAQKAEALRELEYWKSQAMKNGATETPKQEPKVEAKQESQGEPQPDQYETAAEYYKAVARWEIKQERETEKREMEKSKLLSDQENLVKSHRDRVKAFAAKTEDFQELVENLPQDARSLTVEQIILKSENGPELLYELAKNPEEARRICSLGPIDAAYEMGLIKARIASQPSDEKPEPKKLTSAPKPIEPVGGSKSAATRRSINDPDLPFSEYVELRRAQMKRRR